MKDKIIILFQSKYPELFEKMEKTQHNYSCSSLNPYHSEGSVWTHTISVMTWIYAQPHIFEKDKKLLLITAMLHDLGKLSTQELKPETQDKPKRYSFHGHEGESAIFSTDILKNFKKELELSEQDIKDILYLISTHGLYIDKNCYLWNLRNEFRIADKKGAVRNEDENISSMYPKRRYSISKNCEKDPDKECIILTGLPCSGKSTYRKTLEEKGYKIISRDDEILEYSNIKNYNEAYKKVHKDKEVLKEFDSYFDKKVNSYSKFNKICIDMTMLSLKSRRNMMNRFKRFKFYSKVFLTDIGTIYKRNEERKDKFININVFKAMSKRFIIPVKEEGFENVEIFI